MIAVAQVKVCPLKGNLGANAARLMEVLAEVAEQAPDVVVTPECFLDGYVATESQVSAEDMAEYAVDPASSVYCRAVADWAQGNRCWVVLGCTRRGGDAVYNSALIYGRDGRLEGIYDKVHLQMHDLKFRPGMSLPVFRSDFGSFGVMICADRRWPETVRTLALRGTRVIFNPTYGQHDELNTHMMETRSFESEVFIAFTHPFQALMTAPTGEVLLNERSPDVAFTVCEIDLDEVDTVRARPLAHLRDRRPEVYEW